jgi:hypothetical protein
MPDEPIKADLPCQGCGDTDTWSFPCEDGKVVFCVACAWKIAFVIRYIRNLKLAAQQAIARWN